MKLNETAKRCDEVLRIAKNKNLEEHTCYNCKYLGDDEICSNSHKIRLYVLKFGPFIRMFYHRDNETWVCKDKKQIYGGGASLVISKESKI